MAAALPGYFISHKNRKYHMLFIHIFKTTNYNKPLLWMLHPNHAYSVDLLSSALCTDPPFSLTLKGSYFRSKLALLHVIFHFLFTVLSCPWGAPKFCRCLWSKGTTKVRWCSEAYETLLVNSTLGMTIDTSLSLI